MSQVYQGYQGLEAEWHDLFWEDEDAPSELPFLEEFLSGVDGSSLYVGSGSGRLLGPLVEKGHAITGLELSPEMVELSQKTHPSAKVLTQNWEEVDSVKKWSALLLPGFTFQLFPSPAKQFKKMANLVEDGGKAYVSLFFPWAEMSGDLPEGKWYHDRELKLPDGLTGVMRTRHYLDHQVSMLRREHHYLLKDQDGNVLREDKTKQRIRVFADGELEKMLKKAGWKIKREIHDFVQEDEAATETDDVVYVITLFLEKSA